jgi:ABC-2 type transport system permease protein
MNKIVSIAIKDFKLLIRNRSALFWNIMFPLLIMLLFVAIFGRQTPITINVGIIDQDNDLLSETFIEALNSSNLTRVLMFNNKIDAEEAISSQEIEAYIIIPGGFTSNLTSGRNTYVDIYVDMSNPDTTQITEGLLREFVSRFNEIIREKWIEYSEQYFPPHVISYIYSFAKPINASIHEAEAGPRVGYKEYIISGMIGYGFLFSALASATNVIVKEKEEKTIKRIKLSKANPWDILIGKTIAILFNLYLYIGIMLGIAYLLLKPEIYWNIPQILFLSLLGGLGGIAIGLILSILSESPEAASGASISIAVFLQFFIGLYFPIEFLPEYLQIVSNILPFTIIVNVLRDTMLYNIPLFSFLNMILIVLLFDVALYLLGSMIYLMKIQREEV